MTTILNTLAPVQSSHLPSSVPETRVWNAAHYDPGDIISGTSHSWVSPESWVVNQLFLTIAPHTTISPAFFLSSLTDGDVFGAGGGFFLYFGVIVKRKLVERDLYHGIET